MKGVILAGGLGTRMGAVTKVVNKHLLDVFDEPVIFFPIRALARAGISEIVIVTSEEAIPQFRTLLDDGSEFGVRLEYAVQPEADLGISDAIGRAEPLVKGSRVLVHLGDNIFQEDLTPYVDTFRHQDKGAKILLKRVGLDDAHRFGVALIEKGKIVRIEEKPKDPKSDLAQTGCYMYDDRVFDLIRTLEPSARGELEVTDLNNLYIDEGTMTFDILKGWWVDAGTPSSKLKASILVSLEKGVTFHR